jgi:cryptochrome
VPELARFPAKYIYEPWKAPIADQTKAGCRVGVDYPKPIVAHDVASKANMGLMADAYRAYKEGDAGTSASGGGGAAAPAAKAKGAKDGAVSAGAAGRKRALGS